MSQAGARGAGRSRVGSAATAAALCCALTALLFLATGGTAHAAKRAPELGIWDPILASGDSATRAEWLDRTVDVGAQQVTLQANWRHIARSKPADPTDPDDPAYDWTQLDAAVRAANARGFSIMVMLYRAPDWAEGPGRDPVAGPGTWRPDPDAFGVFARVIGKRYSGGFSDPLAPSQTLPKVSLWQIWGEPNLWADLNPQWEKSGGKWRTASPAIYRSLVNSAYSALNGLDPANRVVAGGLSPVGDYERGGLRLAPLRFWRDFFCLQGRKALKPKHCKGGKPHLDVLGHNPLSVYGGGGPFKSAAQPDDVWVPDMHELTRIIRAARSHNRIVPRRGTKLWATELLAWTKPPVDYGISETGQAKYLADALYVLWRQGVSEVSWVGISDGNGFGSGLYYDDGTPKLSAQAFRFSFVVRSKGKRRVRVWGIPPTSGPVQIERQNGDGWDAIATLKSKRGVFNDVLHASDGSTLRATVGGQHSLPR